MSMRLFDFQHHCGDEMDCVDVVEQEIVDIFHVFCFDRGVGRYDREMGRYDTLLHGFATSVHLMWFVRGSGIAFFVLFDFFFISEFSS